MTTIPPEIEQYCQENNWVDPFLADRRWWAFPGICAVLPLPVPRLKTEEGLILFVVKLAPFFGFTSIRDGGRTNVVRPVTQSPLPDGTLFVESLVVTPSENQQFWGYQEVTHEWLATAELMTSPAIALTLEQIKPKSWELNVNLGSLYEPCVAVSIKAPADVEIFRLQDGRAIAPNA